MNCTEVLQESMPVEEFNKMVDAKIAAIKDDEVIAFVDGSYDVSQEKSAFAAIMITSGGNRDTLYKSFTKNLDKDFIALRNVAAELEGVKEAINWSVTYNKKKITVFYDYEGIEKWANATWKANKKGTQEYQKKVSKYRENLEIIFVKVLAHSGDFYNEKADMLAKKAVGING